jgi:uncharacterized protein (TIGR01777 family)
MARILLSGSSGTIGSALLASFQRYGHTVTRLVRSSQTGRDEVNWDPMRPVAPQSVSGFDAVVHLAGESIVGRWSEDKKRKILESRRAGTRNLSEALAKAQSPPRVLLSASAIGIYGNRGNEVLSESSPPGNDFLSTVAREWEAATEPAKKAAIRTVNLRIGIMLSAKGGALAQMLTPFRLGLGGRVGNGRQWWSWVHIDDVAGAFSHAMVTDQLEGPVNLTAPVPVTNAEFTQSLARVLHRPALFPVPAFAARLAFGEMADQLLLSSQRVEPAKLASSGYKFAFSEIGSALKDAIKG